MVAVELYRVMKEIEGLEKKLESLDAGSQGRLRIEDAFRKARAEKVLAGKDDRGSQRRLAGDLGRFSFCGWQV
jgi:hypothetical protein